jgi:pimeloyl-ACP methyl ester carboxylesterase
MLPTESSSCNHTFVAKRCVVYFSGFDPSGPAKYHKLYADQAALAAPLLNMKIHVGPRKTGPYLHTAQWHIHSGAADMSNELAQTTTDMVFARWDDIIRSHWMRVSTWRERFVFLREFMSAQWLGISSGGMRQAMKLHKAPCRVTLIALLLVVLLTTSILCGLALLIVAALISTSANAAPGAGSSYWLTSSLFFLSSVALVALSVQLNKRWHMLWLMRAYVFTSKQARGLTPEHDSRLAHFARCIRDLAQSSVYDELLIVGHSYGSMMAGLALSQALLEPLETRTQINHLTMAHLWPTLTCLPSAKAQRDLLVQLSCQPDLNWVDLSSAADGSCFPFVDPLRGLHPYQFVPPGANAPKMLSVRWHTLFSPSQYQALRQDPFRLHFQYIYSTPIVGDGDYFAITAGPQTLRQRFMSFSSVV